MSQKHTHNMADRKSLLKKRIAQNVRATEPRSSLSLSYNMQKMRSQHARNLGDGESITVTASATGQGTHVRWNYPEPAPAPVDCETKDADEESEEDEEDELVDDDDDGTVGPTAGTDPSSVVAPAPVQPNRLVPWGSWTTHQSEQSSCDSEMADDERTPTPTPRSRQPQPQTPFGPLGATSSSSSVHSNGQTLAVAPAAPLPSTPTQGSWDAGSVLNTPRRKVRLPTRPESDASNDGSTDSIQRSFETSPQAEHVRQWVKSLGRAPALQHQVEMGPPLPSLMTRPLARQAAFVGGQAAPVTTATSHGKQAAVGAGGPFAWPSRVPQHGVSVMRRYQVGDTWVSEGVMPEYSARNMPGSQKISPAELKEAHMQALQLAMGASDLRDGNESVSSASRSRRSVSTVPTERSDH